MIDDSGSFQHATNFEPGEVSGNVQLGRLEGYYEELFAEVIEDGVITSEERARLDRMADSLGLDRTRLRKLENALQAAYEARHRVVIREQLDEEEPRASLQPLEPATDARTLALERRIVALQERVADLERDLEEARSHVAVEVDLSDVSPPAGKPVPDDDPAELARRVRHDPRDEASLHALYRQHARAGEPDRQWCTADVLVYLGAATSEEASFHTAHRTVALIRPTASLARDGWTRLLFHPEEEPVTGDIFAAIVPAVLMGRLSALRRDKALPKLDPTKKQDPVKSTLQAVRCFAWGAAILGMSAPSLYADPEYEGAVEMVPAIPPAARLGARALSGRSASELAFLAGRHLALHRAEHFVRLIVPEIRDLEDLFLAALSIGNPGLALNARVKELVVPIAKAIEPILEPAAIDRLRGHFLRFIEEGGRTNLQRWAAAVDMTSARAGLLLANDLRAADKVFEHEGASQKTERMNDLLVFATSDRYAKLRKQIGIAIP